MFISSHLAKYHKGRFCFIDHKKRIRNFTSRLISGGASESHQDLLEIHASILKEIEILISKSAVVQVEDNTQFCLSPIFTVPKPSGELHVIFNLKEVNSFLPGQKFWMEILSAILPQLSN